MDINGTYFHLLTGENDWERELEKQGVRELWWDRERASLNLLPQVLQLPRSQSDDSPQTTPVLLKPADRRGAARDRYDNSFWISEDRRGIYILPAGATDSAIYWGLDELASTCVDDNSNSDFSPVREMPESRQTRLQGLTISHLHYLVVGTLQPGGLLVFDLHAGGAPSWLHWPEALQFTPFDMAPTADGGICILDSDLQTDTARYWQLDRYLRVVNPRENALAPEQEEPDFQPLDAVLSSVDDESLKIYHGSLSLQPAIPLSAHQAIAIEALTDGSVLILASSDDDSCSALQHIRHGVVERVIELRDELLAQVFAEPYLKAHDFALLAQAGDFPGQFKAELKLVLDNGDQAVSFLLTEDDTDLKLVIQPLFIPLRQFSGKALMSGSQAIYYDMQQRWFVLTEQPRRRYASEAVIDGLVFDGKQSHCVWHRIVIDGCIPDATAIEIESRCADEEALLPYSDWQAEVNPYLRGDGSEIPLHQAYSKDEMHGDDMGSWEWLMQNARGRYLELRLRFRGNGRSTPRIRAMRVYYPRFSYLEKFLPAVYREDILQASFLDRYLANVEGFFSKLESQIANAQAYFDTRTAPAEYLQWLASWLGAVMDESWSEQRQRLFIDHAELLFRWRGTRIGLRAVIRLIIDECPDETIFQELKDGRDYTPTGAAGGSVRIVERFMYRRESGVFIGDPARQQGLAVSTVSNSLEELGDRNTLDRRYAEFIYHRYAQLAGSNSNALVLLNQAWQTQPPLNAFDEIEFNEQRPENATELQDWYQFLRHELALVQAWDPSQGVYALHVRFQEYCRRIYSQQFGEELALVTLNQNWQTTYARFEDIVFSPITPAQPETARDWIDFTETSLGFGYAQVGEKDTALYQEFLARRYKHIDRLNQSYGLGGANAWLSFTNISLPAEDAMPSSPTALHDWIQFVSLMLPIRRNAHRFTVLVPTEPGELPDRRAQRMAQVAAIVKREKPAHADFDVKLYWALFQVGSARLGLDTSLGDGARYVAIVLGASYMGQGMLDSAHPWNITDRHILGRDQL